MTISLRPLINQGTRTRSLYHFKLLIALVEEVGFHLAQECFWYNPAKMPVPAEWVTVQQRSRTDRSPSAVSGSASRILHQNADRAW